MRFWLARHSEVPIREQLVTQVVLGILSDDLRAGQRLPSTRELARRFRVHANTVSAAYRQLERDRWVEHRRGSGVYVRRAKPAAHSATLPLDQLIAGLFRSARELGAPLAAIRSRLRQWLALQPPDHFLLIEPDEELRSIVIAEVRQAVTFPVAGCGLEGCGSPEKLAGAIPIVLPSKVEMVRRALPEGAECLALRVRSVPGSLAPWLPARQDSLIGIASRWPDFLKSARTMLIAAGFHPDSLVSRDARKPGWKKGLRQTVAIICDSLTATKVPPGCRVIAFPLLSEVSLAELSRHQEFITRPLA
jgi:DNA-binding transcriptional regulator YhcF (GntR family)